MLPVLHIWHIYANMTYTLDTQGGGIKRCSICYFLHMQHLHNMHINFIFRFGMLHINTAYFCRRYNVHILTCIQKI